MNSTSVATTSNGDFQLLFDFANDCLPKTDISRQLNPAIENLTVAIAQLKLRPTRFEDNYKLIIQAIDQAVAAKVDLLVFPELSITGYSALDNFADADFIATNRIYLDKIAEYTKGIDLTIIIGFVDQQAQLVNEGTRDNYYNSAAVLHAGQILGRPGRVGVTDKTLLPDYNIFWEPRYFKSGNDRQIVDVKGVKVGIEICEDLWEKDYTVSVTNELVQNGAELIVNLSASPFEVNKYKTRYALVSEQARTHQVPFIYANLVGAQDGYEGEIVFDGRSMVCDAKGHLIAMGKSFDDNLLITSFKPGNEMTLPDIQPEAEVAEALILGIKDYCNRIGFKRVYIGLSGGIDSAVTAALAVKALGSENVIGITMPSHITSTETYDDALRLAAKLGIRCDVRPIKEIYEPWLEGAQKQHSELDSLTRQNVQARLRGLILMEYTNQDRSGMVLTTGNKTETALGYMTLYGDMCGGLAVLADVSKNMVYDLARYLNRSLNRELIPESIIERVPSAELEEGQKDRDNLPADYPILSPLVDALIERTATLDQLVKKYPSDVVYRTARLIKQNEYKRRQAPPGIRVTGMAFGGGRRFPIDAA